MEGHCHELPILWPFLGLEPPCITNELDGVSLDTARDSLAL